MLETAVPLSIFTAFVSAPTGAGRLAKVAEAQEKYDPRHDFYKPLREAAVRSIVTKDPRHVHRAAEHAHQTRRDHYSACALGLEKWMKKTSYEVVERPGSILWESAGLGISVTPELLLRIDETLVLVKLYLRQDPLTRDGKNAFSFLVATTHGKALKAEPRLLVLRSAQLQQGHPPRGIAKIVEGEVAMFLSLWRSDKVA